MCALISNRQRNFIRHASNQVIRQELKNVLSKAKPQDCSELIPQEQILRHKLKILKHVFQTRGYQETRINNTLAEMNFDNRSAALQQNPKRRNKILPFSKWFEPRSISSSCSVIVRVSVVLKRTVGDSDWRFDNLSSRHLQSHCDNVPSVDGIYVSGYWPDWSIKLSCYWL